MDNNDTSVDDEIDNGGGDEDDHDPAEILIETFDLALIKLFNPAGSDFPLIQNRNVAFEIQIGNQGTVDATQIEITDYIPTGLTLDDPNWTDNGNGTACLLYTSPSPRDATLSRMPSSA